mgnify:CR=1 FL=1
MFGNNGGTPDEMSLAVRPIELWALESEDYSARIPLYYHEMFNSRQIALNWAMRLLYRKISKSSISESRVYVSKTLPPPELTSPEACIITT